MRNFYAYTLFMILGIVIGIVESNTMWNTSGSYALAVIAVLMVTVCLVAIYLDSDLTRQLVIKTLISIVSTMLLLTLAVYIWSEYVMFLYTLKVIHKINVLVKVIILFVPLVLEFTITSIMALMVHRYLKVHDIDWFKKKTK